MFGRQPRLPIDLAFNVTLNHSHQRSHSQYVQALKTKLQESYQLVARNAAKTAERNKTNHVTESTLDVGDRVLVRNIRLRGKHKLADKSEAVVHVVVNRRGDLPVYTVKPENKDGPLRTLHRDLLLPCGVLPALKEETPVVSSKPRRPSTRQHPDPNSDEQEPELNSDGEDDYLSYCVQDPILTTIRSTKEYEMIMPPREQSHSSVEQTCSDTVTFSDVAPEISAENLAGNPTFLERESLPEMESIHTRDQPGKENLPEQTSDRRNRT